MITPEIKDIVLKDLIESGEMNINFDGRKYARDIGIDFDYLNAVIDQFEKIGLLTTNKFLGGNIEVYLTADSHDFYLHGGFTAQEQLLRDNIKKLLLEIEGLKPSLPDKVEKITTIAGGIATALGLFIKG